MEDMNELQMTCFEIISYVGTAKSMYINAVQKAKEGDFDAAEELIKQGDEAYNGGHDVHMGLLKKEANGERNGEAPLILLHGLTDNGLCWNQIPMLLEVEYDVIMPDARGHGVSQVGAQPVTMDLMALRDGASDVTRRTMRRWYGSGVRKILTMTTSPF